MTSLRIVELIDGRFAVQKSKWVSWEFCGVRDNYVWTKSKYVEDYCMIDTLEEAEESLKSICNQIRKKRMKNKMPRVTRVLKKIKV